MKSRTAREAGENDLTELLRLLVVERKVAAAWAVEATIVAMAIVYEKRANLAMAQRARPCCNSVVSSTTDLVNEEDD